MRSGWLARCTGLLLFALSSLAVHAAEPDHVLLLHSFGPHFAPWSTISPQFREELRKRASRPIDLYEASLEGERFGTPADDRPFIEYLRALFEQRHLELVVTLGAPATRFFLRNRAQLFPSIPLLIAATDARTFSDGDLTDNDALVPVKIDQTRHIDNILRILPDTTDIVVAIGNSPLEKFWVTDLRSTFERYAGRVTFHWLNELSAEQMVDRVAKLPAHHAIYYATVRVDAHGAPQESDRVLLEFFKIANAPIFTYLDSHFGLGIVGGPLLSTQEVAAASADGAVRILDGESPGKIRPPAVSDAAAKYDWRQLQRFGIDQARLPSGSTIQFRVPTVWEAYRTHILVVSGVLVLQALLINWLIYEHRQRNRAEVRSRIAMGEIANLNRLAAAGQLSGSIAHEINQPISGMVMKASAALRWLQAEKPDVQRASRLLTDIVGAGHRAAEIITSIRAMFSSGSGTKSAVNVNRLIGTVLTLLRMELQSGEVRVEVQFDSLLPPVHGDPVQLQQVMLNLVVNAVDAMRAVQPRVLKIRTGSSASGTVHVQIEDSGIGIREDDLRRIFDPLFTTKSGGMGMGLSICRSIIESHGGKIWAAPAAKGTIFEFELPAAVDAQGGQDLAA